MGIETGSERTQAFKISSVNQLPKGNVRKENKQYKLSISWKTYVFLQNGRAGLVEKGNKVTTLRSSAEIVKEIKKIEQQNKQLALQQKNAANAPKNKEQSEPLYYKQLFLSVVNWLNDLDGLQVILERDADKYRDLVNAPWFQTRLDRSIRTGSKTKADIVRIQLLWKFKYNLNTTVNGQRSAECKDVIDMWKITQQENTLRNKIETDNRELMKKLYALVKSGDRGKIENELNTNASKYAYLATTNRFLDKFEQAKSDPQHNVVLIQLYGRFVLQNQIAIDGIYKADQVDSILSQSLSRSTEKERAERKARYEQANQIPEWDIIKQNTAIISEKFLETLSPEDKARYAKMLDISPTIVDGLLQKKDQKWPQKAVTEKRERRQHALSEIAIKSAAKWCINYLQELFKQPTSIDSEGFQKALEWFASGDNVSTHDKNIDFKVYMDGKEVDLCYNMADGQINYAPKYFVNENQTICKNKLWSKEFPVFKNGKTPSITSLMEKAKSNIESASSKLFDQWSRESVSNNRWIIRESIKQIEVPEIDINQDKFEFAKKIEKEECIQKFVEITGYDLPQDLEKQSHQNDQLYILYDTINRTIDAQKTPDDIDAFEWLLEKFSEITGKYSNPSEKLPVNMWNAQFSQENIKKVQTNTLWPKQTSEFKDSLPFYSLFTQYTNPAMDEQNPEYRVMNTQKIKSDLALYEQNKYLPEDVIQKNIVNVTEQKEKEEADNMLKNLA